MNSIPPGLASITAADMTPEQIVVLGWQDGPIEGLIVPARPRRTWYFTLIAARFRRDAPDDRLYLLSGAPAAAVDRLAGVLRDVDPPVGRVWVPTWTDEDPQLAQRVEAVLAELMGQLEPPSLILRTADLQQIEDLWLVEPNISIARPA
jgi:hypothetical protein